MNTPHKKLTRKLTEGGWILYRNSKHEVWKHPNGKTFILPRHLSDHTRQYVNYGKQLDRLCTPPLEVIVTEASIHKAIMAHPPEIQLTWYEWVKRAREKDRLTQHEVEVLIGLPVGTMTRIEIGKRKFSSSELDRWKDAFLKYPFPMYVPLASDANLIKRASKTKEVIMSEEVTRECVVESNRALSVADATKILNSTRLTDKEVVQLVQTLKENALNILMDAF